MGGVPWAWGGTGRGAEAAGTHMWPLHMHPSCRSLGTDGLQGPSALAPGASAPPDGALAPGAPASAESAVSAGCACIVGTWVSPPHLVWLPFSTLRVSVCACVHVVGLSPLPPCSVTVALCRVPGASGAGRRGPGMSTILALPVWPVCPSGLGGSVPSASSAVGTDECGSRRPSRPCGLWRPGSLSGMVRLLCRRTPQCVWSPGSVQCLPQQGLSGGNSGWGSG